MWNYSYGVDGLIFLLFFIIFSLFFWADLAKNDILNEKDDSLTNRNEVWTVLPTDAITTRPSNLDSVLWCVCR